MQACWIWYPGDFEIYHGIVVRLLTLERANEEIPSKDSWKTQLTKVADLNISATPAVPFTLRRDKMLI